MNLFRAVKPKYSKNKEDAFNGVGSLAGGRWNSKGQAVVYAANELETSLSEAGWYSVVKPLIQIKSILELGPEFWADFDHLKYIDKGLTVFEFEWNGPINWAVFSKNSSLKIYGTRLDYADCSVEKGRKSQFVKIKGRWTQGISKKLNDEGKNIGLQCVSARSDVGSVFPIYSNQMDLNSHIKIIKKIKVKLSATNESGQILQNGEMPSFNQVLCSILGRPDEIVEILRFP